MGKEITASHNLFLSLCLSLCLSPILTCFKLEVMICIAQGKKKKEMKRKRCPIKGGRGDGENPNSIFVGKYLIYLQSTLPTSPGVSRSVSESSPPLTQMGTEFCKGNRERCA